MLTIFGAIYMNIVTLGPEVLFTTITKTNTLN